MMGLVYSDMFFIQDISDPDFEDVSGGGSMVAQAKARTTLMVIPISFSGLIWRLAQPGHDSYSKAPKAFMLKYVISISGMVMHQASFH
jgi:hypothetical protein